MFQSGHLLRSDQNMSSYPEMTCAGSQGTYVVVPKKKNMRWLPRKPCARSQGTHVVVPKKKNLMVPAEDMCWQPVWDVMGWNFGRTDLRKITPKAQFDARADGDVRLAVRRPKPRKICKKLTFRSENFAIFVWLRFFFVLFFAPICFYIFLRAEKIQF